MPGAVVSAATGADWTGATHRVVAMVTLGAGEPHPAAGAAGLLSAGLTGAAGLPPQLPLVTVAVADGTTGMVTVTGFVTGQPGEGVTMMTVTGIVGTGVSVQPQCVVTKVVVLVVQPVEQGTTQVSGSGVSIRFPRT